MYSVGEIIDIVAMELHDDVNSPADEREYPDAQLLQWIQEGFGIIRTLVSEEHEEMLERTDEYEVAIEASDIPLGFDVQKICRARILIASNRYDLTAQRKDSLNHNADAGYPQYFFLSGLSTLVINPVPMDTATVTVTAIEDRPRLHFERATETDDDIPLPEYMADYIKEYVLLRAYNQNEMQAAVEASFMDAHKTKLLKLLEERTPIPPYGAGPWRG